MKYLFSGVIISVLLKISWSFLFPAKVPRISNRPAASTVQAVTEGNVQLNPDILQFDYLNEEKLPWSPNGYHSWNWRGYKINYVQLGGDDATKKPPLVLIHGFGASVYHWRYNLPVLARKFNVFAIDLLGFGLSDKPIVDYTADIWRDQVLDFAKEVVLPYSHNQPCVVAGNSLGGFTALYAASDKRAIEENLVNGCILLNAAGRFRPLDGSVEEKPQSAIMRKITEVLQRFVIGLSFIYTKQPLRIEQVLKQVYPVNKSVVDSELVASIQHPAQDDNAAEVFYRVVSRNGAGPSVYVDDLLAALKVPLLLLWGVQDPWIRPKAADRIQELFPGAQRVDVLAGHCPHDEAPDEVNAAIDSFVTQLAEIRKRVQDPQ